MVTLVNRAKMTTATTGTGTITLGAAESGYQTFADAGVVNSDVVRYVIEDGTAWEIGTGTYSAGTLTRALSESSTGSLLNLTGSAVVYVSATAEDIPPVLELYAENPSSTSSPTATGTDAVAIGDSRGIASGVRSLSVGNSRAGNESSFAVQIGNNSTSYGASGSLSISIGAATNATASSSVSIGSQTQSTSNNTVAIGLQCVASQLNSVALGSNASSVIRGKYAYAGGRFSVAGDAQTGVVVLRSDTTDATPEALTTDNSASLLSVIQVILPNNSAYAFHGTIVARQQASAGTACAAWKIEGLIRREGSAGTTVLVNSATTILDNTPAWGMALSADTTNGGLKIEVTGAAATNIRWVATINTSEVTY
jgi:hypothetical protein